MRALLTALLLVMGAGAAAAQGAWYARGFGGVTFPRGNSTTVDGLVWAFERDPVPPTARIIWPGPWTDLDYDAGYTLGAAAGYALRPDVGGGARGRLSGGGFEGRASTTTPPRPR